jgi:hypothetical protein
MIFAFFYNRRRLGRYAAVQKARVFRKNCSWNRELTIIDYAVLARRIEVRYRAGLAPFEGGAFSRRLAW